MKIYLVKKVGSETSEDLAAFMKKRNAKNYADIDRAKQHALSLAKDKLRESEEKWFKGNAGSKVDDAYLSKYDSFMDISTKKIAKEMSVKYNDLRWYQCGEIEIHEITVEYF